MAKQARETISGFSRLLVFHYTMDFLIGENGFASLKNSFTDPADVLYAKEAEDVKARYERYKKLAENM